MQEYSKAITAVVGLVAMLISTGVLDGSAQLYVNAAIAALTALGVYAVPNKPSKQALAEKKAR